MARTAVVLGDVILDVRATLDTDFAGAISNSAAEFGDISLALAGTGPGMARALVRHFDDVRLLGALGRDIGSDLLGRLLHDEPFECVLFGKSDTRVGTAVVLRDTRPEPAHGDRIAVVSRGPNDAITEADILGVRDTFEAADLLCVDGYGLLSEPRRTATLRAMRLASEAGCDVFLDLVPHDLFRHWSLDDCRRLAANATIIGTSGTTLAHLLDVPWPGMKPVDRPTALHVAELATSRIGPKTYLVHFGEGHCTNTIAYRAGAMWTEQTDYPHIPPHEVAGFGDRLNARELSKLVVARMPEDQPHAGQVV